MSGSAPIRITEDPESVFDEVLRSLESHRPSKAETDILDAIRKEFRLPRNRSSWPRLLASQTTVEAFLSYALVQLTPFVEMLLDIYRFLSHYVSTTGGRTSHFEIDSDALSQAWRFDNVDFPRRVRWITAWTEVNIEHVVIDWPEIGDLLRNDNGIFYGTIDDVRILQSLIIARREGELCPELRRIGDEISGVLRRVGSAWYRQASSEQSDDFSDTRGWRLETFVPDLHSFLVGEGTVDSNLLGTLNVAVDLDAVFRSGGQPKSTDQVFGDVKPEGYRTLEAVVGEDRVLGRDVEAAVFFCALWALDDESFRQVAGLLTAHEERSDLLRGSELSERGEQLGRQLMNQLEHAIEPTGDRESVQEMTRRKIDLLLLPYWKDRWFLFEVWTLLQPLRHALALGARIDLVGLKPIRNPGVMGETWNLPTQKARNPVARIRAENGNSLLVWFQRETRRLDGSRKMEPDVRLTLPWSPFPDILIIECKDRVRFGGKTVRNLARGYLTGSTARCVWIVNYERQPKRGDKESLEAAEDERCLGFAYEFRPNEIGSAFESSLDRFLREHLHIWPDEPDDPLLNEWLIIDVSGSMDGKDLSHLDEVQRFASAPASRLKLWAAEVADASDEQRSAIFDSRVVRGAGMGTSVECISALEAFAAALPEDAEITLVTDASGIPAALSHPAADGEDHRLADRKVTPLVV